MKFNHSLLLAGVSLAFASTQPLQAVTVLYSTDFNSPTYTDGGIIGQDAWVITGTSVVNPVAVANTATNGTVTLTNNGQDVRRLFTPAASSGSVYLKADITVGAALATGDYFLHLGEAETNNFYARTYIKSSGSGFVMALGTSSGTTGLVYGSTELAFNTSYTMLARYDFVAGLGNDTGALFINPTTDDGSGDTAYVAATTVGLDATIISAVNLRQGTAANAPGLTIDNLSVTVPVPEPAAAVLGSLGLLGLLRRRRSN